MMQVYFFVDVKTLFPAFPLQTKSGILRGKVMNV